MLLMLAPAVQGVHDLVLKAWAKRDRAELMRLLRTLVDANNPLSRAPRMGA